MEEVVNVFTISFVKIFTVWDLLDACTARGFKFTMELDGDCKSTYKSEDFEDIIPEESSVEWLDKILTNLYNR